MSAVPEGTIVAWGKPLNQIPSRWFLCDGTNGTPDLRDKFIKNVGAAENPGATGGGVTHTHTTHPDHVVVGPGDHTTGVFNLLIGLVNAVTGHTHGVITVDSHGAHNSANHEPAFYKSAWIMKGP